MPEESQPAEQRAAASRRLIELINGYQASAAIGALARFGAADALAEGPATSAELAQRTGADERALARLLNATLGMGLFEITGDSRYTLGELGELLRGDAQDSLRRFAVISTEDWRWRAYGELAHTLRTGEPGFVAANGCRLWDHLASHADAATSFEQSMARVGLARDQALVASLDLAGVHCLVDVGGGRGALLCALLAAHPHLRGVVFDLPGVADGARRRIGQAGLGERCEAVAGDFRYEVPQGGDAYLLSWVLHDWDDDTALRILGRCRAAMATAARLLIVEMVLPEPGRPGALAFERLVRQTDLEMLAVVGGRERTGVEYTELLAAAGFSLSHIRPLENMPWSVIEGVAV